MKKFLVLALVILSGCTDMTPNTLPPLNEDEALRSKSEQNQPDDTANIADKEAQIFYSREMQESMPKADEKVVKLETTEGDIFIKLFWEETPTLAENFYTLAEQGKYDNVPFHRVMKDFMIQSGDYTNKDGTGGASYTGKGLADEYSAKLRHIRGALGAAKTSLPNSIGSQFYIAHTDVFGLDNRYSVFGQVYAGMDVVDAIANAEVEANAYGEMSVPTKPILIKKATVFNYEATE